MSDNTLNEEAPEISASFVIGSDNLDSDNCSQMLGISPTEVWRQKREDLLDMPQVPNIQWVIKTAKIKSYCIDEPISCLLEILLPCRDAIKAFVSSSDVECFVTCSVTIVSERPAYEISAKNMLILGDLGASFTMDVFDYSD